MKLIYNPLLLILISSIACSTEKTGSLDQLSPIPKQKPAIFLPGIVSSDSLDFNAAFSPDGRICYFTRTSNGKWQIYQSRFDNGQWQAPTLASFSESDYSQADPFVTADGQLYYISNRPRDDMDTLPDFDIWVVKPLSAGGWSTPENVQGVNTDSTEYYVSLVPNGNMYFASTRAGGYGGLDIYRSEIINGTYQKPENLGVAINTNEDEHDPLILGNEEHIIFAALNRSDGYGEADLYWSSRENLSWSASKNMGVLFNTPTYEYCPNLSPDRKYFFFSSEYDVKWIRSEIIDSLISREKYEKRLILR